MANPADWCGGEKNRRKMTLKMIVDFDHCKRTRYLETIKAAVSEITAWCGSHGQGMYTQFFYDLGVYGIGQAVGALEEYSRDYHYHERVKDKIDKLREKITPMFDHMFPNS